MKKIVASLFALAVLGSAYAAGDLTDLSKPIYVNTAKPDFSITIKSNPTTGYTWFLKNYDSSAVQPLAHLFKAPTKKMPGAPGTEQWTFKATANALRVPSVSQITLIYARPWMLSTPTETVTINVVAGCEVCGKTAGN